MKRLMRGLVAAVALGAALFAQAQPVDKDSGAAFRIALVTAAPGDVYWQRFGHNALLVENTVTGDARMYNFGMFDFGQKNFLLNFARGRMLYRLAALSPGSDLANYAAEGRSVWVQELDLSPDQRYAVAEMLGQNALPENAEYRYDYYAQNCSTKVRDVLDAVLEGSLRETMSVRARGETERTLSMAYARGEPWLAVGIDLGLGPAADRKISYWDEMFLPLRLRDLVREVQVTDADGRTHPLVSREWTAFDGPLNDHVPPPPNWLPGFAAIGLALAAWAWFAFGLKPGWLRTLSVGGIAGVCLLLGLGGWMLAGLWSLTDHAIAYGNLNLVLFSPLALGLVVPIVRWRNPARTPGRVARGIAITIITIALAGFAWLALPGVQQDNTHWFTLILPLLGVIAWRFAFAPTQPD